MSKYITWNKRPTGVIQTLLCIDVLLIQKPQTTCTMLHAVCPAHIAKSNANAIQLVYL